MPQHCLAGIGADQVFEAFTARVLPALEAGRALLA
jgi:hypothetical protein